MGSAPQCAALARNTIFLVAANAGAQIATAGVFVIAARLLGPASFGIVAGAYGFGTLLVLAMDWGLTSWTIREAAGAVHARDLFEATLGAKVAAGIAVGSIAAAVAIVLSVVGSTPPWTVLVGIWVLAASVSSTLAIPLRVAERMDQVSAAMTLERLVAAVLGSLLLVLGVGAAGLFVGLLAGTVVSAWFCLRRTFRPRSLWPRLADLRRLWRQSRHFAFASLAVQAQRLDVLIVAAFAGNPAAGVFAAPARLTNILGILPTSFSAALFARISASGRTRSTETEAVRTAIPMLALVVATLIAVGLAAPEAVRFGLGSAYAGSVVVLRIYLIGMVFAAINQPLAVYLQAVGRDAVVAQTTSSAAILGLITIASGAALHGASGAAGAFVLQQVLLSASLIVLFIRNRGTSFAQIGAASANS